MEVIDGTWLQLMVLYPLTITLILFQGMEFMEFKGNSGVNVELTRKRELEGFVKRRVNLVDV